MTTFFKKPFSTIFILIIFVELLSFLSFLILPLRPILFLILGLVILIISFYRLEYGILVLLAELFVGSKGHFFNLTIGSFDFSFRMLLFFIILFVWLVGLFQKKYSVSFFRSKFFTFYLLFFIILAWGVGAGFLHQNEKNLIFYDANAWLYFLLIFPIFDVIVNKEQIKNIFRVFFAAISWLAIRTFIIFFIFTHQIRAIVPDLYYWVRLRGIGEITLLDSFARVFFQSQIYSLIGFFVILSLIVFTSGQLKNKFYFLFIPTIPLILGFSRSFWLAFAVTLAVFFVVLKIKKKFSYFKIIKILTLIVLVFLFSLGFLWFSLKIPPQATIDLSSLFEKRMDLDEPAVSSRMSQLPYLLSANLERPILGSGFGRTISYFSQDPRALERHPLGLYTTYAFEWGFLDIWLKIGLVGLAVFLVLLWQIFKNGWSNSNNNKPLIFGLLFGLIALVTTHITSPYLNHPLGIGYLLVCSVIFYLTF